LRLKLARVSADLTDHPHNNVPTLCRNSNIQSLTWTSSRSLLNGETGSVGTGDVGSGGGSSLNDKSSDDLENDGKVAS